MKSYHKNVKKKTLRECTRGRTYYFEGPFVTLHAPMSSVVADFQPIVVAYIGKKKTTTTSSNFKQKNYYAPCLIVTEG